MVDIQSPDVPSQTCLEEFLERELVVFGVLTVALELVLYGADFARLEEGEAGAGDFVREIDDEDAADEGKENGHGAVDDENPDSVISGQSRWSGSLGSRTIASPSSLLGR